MPRATIARSAAIFVAISLAVMGTFTLRPQPVYANHFTDISDSPFVNDILWLEDQDITAGCSPTEFCPDGHVTRGQMAAFLSRALGLTVRADDPFTDDDTSIFEGDIERIYAAGITAGCGDHVYCPTRDITRAEMAAYLDRAFDLPAGSGNHFTDDNTSPFEGNIEALYASGITAGCSPTQFCPTRPITRAEMAAFLHRAAPYFTGEPTNHAPVLDNIPDQTSEEGESVSLAVSASDADADSLSYSASGLPAGLSIDAGTGLISGTVDTGASSGSPYSVEVTVSDGDLSDSTTFSWTVTSPPSSNASAHVEITPTGGIDASTYSADGFQITNTSDAGVMIESISFDLSTAMLPDIVFDPNGTAGDATGKCLTPDSGSAETGFQTPTDPCTDPYSSPHDGDSADGYDVITLTFTDFAPGETFTFSTDVDPTSIKGASTTGGSGSVGGVELTGSNVSTTFSDGTIATDVWHIPSSDSGSQATLVAGLPAAPQLDVSGVTLESTTLSDAHTAATVEAGTQTVLVTGTPNADVSVLVLDVVLSATPGYDLETYEANNVEAIDSYEVALDGSGSGSVAVTLAEGLNYIAAAELSSAGDAGDMSNVVVLDYQPGGGTSGVIYRINAGGPLLSDTAGDWLEDQAAASADAGGTAVAGTPSQYVNDGTAGDKTYGQDVAISMDASVPAGTPEALFQRERYDPPAGDEMQWSFPVDPGSYEVRLYFAELYSGAMSEGARVFDVSIEGNLVLDNYDIYAAVGGETGVMKSFIVTSDDTLTITFGHDTENPAIKGIEILATDVAGILSASPSSVDFGNVEVGTTAGQTVTLTNLGTTGDPTITISDVSAGGDFSASLAGSDTLAPGGTTTVDVSFTPGSSGSHADQLTVTHSGSNSPLSVALSGDAYEPGSAPVSFNPQELSGTDLGNPTSLQFGPDDRLYVSQQNGLIKAYTIIRNGTADYSITDTETIDLINNITNHNDDGTVATGVNGRQVTGLLVAGTAANPVLYVTSSDPRIGAGGSGTDTGLDTNSGTISRLTWNGTSWDKVDLVHGLPRSEENHSTNGMALDTSTNTLYVAQGGNTNAGAPANNFALLPEYALSAAILSVDLDAIGDTTYNLPTLDATSPNEPFGGMDGANQALLVSGGPVQVYSPGFRNPYDLVLTADGQLYTIDNGSNAGWGDVPVNEGAAGNCTNGVNEGGPTDSDNLHYISGAGYYGGHPNPTRGNTANTFGGQSPVQTGANPIECDYQMPGSGDGALTLFNSSTNGLTEYTASNFGGAMAGDLLAASFSGNVWRIQLNGAGDAVTDKTSLFSGFASSPLDVTAQGDDDIFPGTVWVAAHGSNDITVFEPGDYDGGGGTTCTGADDPSLDEDSDGYTNADEIDNGTDPCSAASTPPDYDSDGVSNLNDPDDDNDGINDTTDPFAVDPDNGMTTSIPVTYDFSPNSAPDSLLGLGFTGLMTNGTDYLDLFDPDSMTAGGAAGVLTVDAVPAGDAHAATNTQQYGFQFGIDAASATEPFTVHTQVLSPFGGSTPSNYQSVGLFIGNGDQDNYLKLVVAANGGTGGIQFAKEVAGSFTSIANPDVASVVGSSSVDLYLVVDPTVTDPTVEAYYSIDGGALQSVGSTTIPAEWVTASDGTALAVGVIATSNGADPFTASWNLIEVTSGTVGGGGGTAAHYRVNAGGPAISSSDGPDWTADTSGAPSEYVNAVAADTQTYSTGDTITLDSSVPAGTPMELFQTERYDQATGEEMTWSFPVTAGTTYEVRLYLAEIFLDSSNNDTQGPRIFDVTIEGSTVISGLDMYDQYGSDVGVMQSFSVTPTDDTLTITFVHDQENPNVKAIEVIEQ